MEDICETLPAFVYRYRQGLCVGSRICRVDRIAGHGDRPAARDAMGGLVHANIVRIIAERNLTDWR